MARMKSRPAQRKQILPQPAGLETMAYGSLGAGHRPARGDGTTGAYQAWEHGKNLRQRIPAAEAPAWQQAVANRPRAEALAQEYSAVMVQSTRPAGRR